MKERDRLESEGFGDQLMEMQKMTALFEEIGKVIGVSTCVSSIRPRVRKCYSGADGRLIKEGKYHIVVDIGAMVSSF